MYLRCEMSRFNSLILSRNRNKYVICLTQVIQKTIYKILNAINDMQTKSTENHFHAANYVKRRN